MSAQEWAGLVLTVLSIAGIALAALRWYIGLQIEPIKESVTDIKQVVQEIKSETKTNGGSSMRDEIKYIKKEQEEAKEIRLQTNKKIDHLYEVLIDYISRNSI